MVARAGSSLFERLSESAFRDLMTDKPVGIPTQPPQILLQRCPVCNEWLTESWRWHGQCRACGAWIKPLGR